MLFLILKKVFLLLHLRSQYVLIKTGNSNKLDIIFIWSEYEQPELRVTNKAICYGI